MFFLILSPDNCFIFYSCMVHVTVVSQSLNSIVVVVVVVVVVVSVCILSPISVTTR